MIVARFLLNKALVIGSICFDAIIVSTAEIGKGLDGRTLAVYCRHVVSKLLKSTCEALGDPGIVLDLSLIREVKGKGTLKGIPSGLELLLQVENGATHRPCG